MTLLYFIGEQPSKNFEPIIDSAMDDILFEYTSQRIQVNLASCRLCIITR